METIRFTASATPVPARHDDKGLGIIKALSDYIPENRRKPLKKPFRYMNLWKGWAIIIKFIQIT